MTYISKYFKYRSCFILYIQETPNSSEELLERETAVVLIETAKEKLKGAVQAGLVPNTAAAAVRTAVVRAASTLHEADTRLKRKQVRNTYINFFTILISCID